MRFSICWSSVVLLVMWTWIFFPMEFDTWTQKSTARASPKGVVLAAQEKLYEERCSAKWQRDTLTDKPNEQCSALDLANEIKANDPDEAWQSLADEFEKKGVEGMNGKMKPRESIQSLKNAKLRGEDVVGLSMKRISLFPVFVHVSSDFDFLCVL